MTSRQSPDRSRDIDKSWRDAVAAYEQPDLRRSLWQIANSFLPYFALWWLMIESLSVSYWLTLAMAPLAAGFLIRVFIISHDCGHGAFFRSRTTSDIVGAIAAVLAFTPYGSWTYQHKVHHASSGDLDRRDVGDVWTLTVVEYGEAPWWTRAVYRFYRFPLVMFVLGPIFQFFIANRFYRSATTAIERRSVLRTNIALAAIIAAASLTIGFKAYVMVQVPIMIVAGVGGVWLFYVQHQFEGVYWERHEKWDYVAQALEGSSYYKLPKLLQWFSGNIGFHHVHHLSPRVPNYNLERCHRGQPLFRNVTQLTMRTALRSLRLRLWDEDRREMVGFRSD